MKHFTMDSLKELLVYIFFDDEDKGNELVVPLTNSFLTPMNKENVYTDTYIGYIIDRVKVDSTAVLEKSHIDRRVVYDVHLGFFGKDSELWANECLFLPMRKDINEKLSEYPAVINNKGLEIYSEPYIQEGLSSTVIWIVKLRISGVAFVDIDEQEELKSVKGATGSIIIEQ